MPIENESPRDPLTSRALLHASLREQLTGYRLDLSDFFSGPHPRFHREATAQAYGHGFVTSNRDLYEVLIAPIVRQNSLALKKLDFSHLINALQLLTFLTYDLHVGAPDFPGNFYRWGGDLRDIDEPQVNDVRTDKAYGLDCSGYVASGFDIAIQEGLLPEVILRTAYFSWRKKVLTEAPLGQPSPHRLNVKELIFKGYEIFNQSRVNEFESMNKLRPGDFLVIPKAPGVFAHVVSVVEVLGELYIAESSNATGVTRAHIVQHGSLLPLHEGLQRLAKRGVNFSARRAFHDAELLKRSEASAVPH